MKMNWWEHKLVCYQLPKERRQQYIKRMSYMFYSGDDRRYFSEYAIRSLDNMRRQQELSFDRFRYQSQGVQQSAVPGGLLGS